MSISIESSINIPDFVTILNWSMIISESEVVGKDFSIQWSGILEVKP
jgi:hypothetical protein